MQDVQLCWNVKLHVLLLSMCSRNCELILCLVRAERKEIKYPPVGEEITGKVDALTNYGVFVKVNDDLRALLHQDEVATKDGRDPDIRAMFNVGEDIKVRGGLAPTPARGGRVSKAREACSS